MHHRILMFLLCIFGIAGVTIAQQDAMFTRYMFNSMYLFNNPAYSGMHGNWTTNLLYRTQWVQFEGAPQTYFLGAEGMLSERQNAGLGFSLYRDKVGLDQVTDFAANYAYHIQLDGQGQRLAFGFKVGAFQYRSALSQATVWDSGDPIYDAGDIQGIIPRAGLGVFWYGQDHFLGLSIPTLVALDNRTTFNLNLDRAGTLRRHYYAYGGYVFHLDNDLDIKPSVLLKYQPEAPLQADFNLNAWFADVFSVGVSYRTGDAISVMAEIPLTQQLRIGYAFDHTTSELQQVAMGTHEIMLGFNFQGFDANSWDRIRPINRF